MIQRYVQFLSFIKGSGTSFSTTFSVWFSVKLFLLYSINWPTFIVRLSLLLEILGNICVAIISCPICEINLSFLIKPFCYMIKKIRRKIDSSPTLTQIPAALIRPTNLSWFKQISKGWIYQFNCRFLSKINFNLLNPFTNRLWDIFRFILRQLRMTICHKIVVTKKIFFLQMHNTILQRVK